MMMLDRSWLLLVALAALTAFAPATVVLAQEEESAAKAEVSEEAEMTEDVAAEESADEAVASDKDDDEAGHHESGDHDDANHDDGDHDSHAGHDAGSHGASTPDPLATDLDLAWWTLAVFVLMLVILTKTAWKPIMAALQEREDKIDGAIASAGDKLKEAEGLLAKHQAELAGAADEVRGLLEEARRDADATIAQAKSDAKSEFEAERLRASRDIEQARSAAVRQLAEQTAGLAIDLAGKVVKQDIAVDRQKEIVHEALGRFANSSDN